MSTSADAGSAKAAVAAIAIAARRVNVDSVMLSSSQSAQNGAEFILTKALFSLLILAPCMPNLARSFQQRQKMRFAVVEDNQTLAKGIAHQLRDQGHGVDVLHDGAAALEFLLQDSADMVILDVNLPTLSGFEVLRSLRTAGKTMPIIMLTARGDLKDRVAGLDAGADDYLIKPFDMEELDARIRALIRRKPLDDGALVQIGVLSYDRTGRKLQVSGADISLTQRELAVFECLFERSGQLVSKTQIADHLYGIGAEVEERVIEVYVSRVRKKLSAAEIKIKAARGLGYMMAIPA